MTFIDYFFIPLFLISLIPYYLFPKNKRWIILLILSILFYCTYGIGYLIFVVYALLIAYIGALLIDYNHNSNINKIILWLSIILILMVLVLSKLQSYVDNNILLNIYNIFFDNSDVSIISILGLSYYTMSLIAYLVDVYRKKDKPERNIFKLALFALYYPKILEGPISRHKYIANTLYKPKDFNYINFCHGLQRMAWGYFKKLCIADRLALFVNTIFVDYINYEGSLILLAGIFGAIQLYCDFSGCMDMVIGMSNVLGIDIEENFKRPFFSKTISEFWRRWHISLGSWLREYIYIPLGGNRCNKFRHCLNLFIVFFISGLWHGSGSNYLHWGIYWGILIVSSVLFNPLSKNIKKVLKIDINNKLFKLFQIIRTFIIFMISMLIVLSDDLLGCLNRIIYYFGFNVITDDSLFNYGLDNKNFWLVIILICFMFYIEYKQEKGISIKAKIDAYPLIIRWAIYLGIIFFILIFGIYGPGYNANAFLYMNY